MASFGRGQKDILCCFFPPKREKSKDNVWLRCCTQYELSQLSLRALFAMTSSRNHQKKTSSHIHILLCVFSCSESSGSEKTVVPLIQQHHQIVSISTCGNDMSNINHPHRSFAILVSFAIPHDDFSNNTKNTKTR